MRILVVEDTPDLAEAVARRLKRMGHAVDITHDGSEAEELLRLETYHLVVLDIMLPGTDGRAILRGLRARRASVLVLVITARSEVDDKVSLLDLGADDYIVKPFDLRELEARCRALLRRPLGMAAAVSRFGNLTFDAAAKRVEVGSQPIALGAREFRLLELFLGNLDRVLTKEALMEQLFGLDEAVAPNALELQISRLRRKLEGASVEIRTLRGLGYAAEVHATH